MAATSLGSPSRPSGVRDRMRRRALSSVMTLASNGVAMLPGPIALTRMPCGARAIAMARIKPMIDRVFDFEDAREAFAHLESGSHFGKVVVRCAK